MSETKNAILSFILAATAHLFRDDIEMTHRLLLLGAQRASEFIEKGDKDE